MTIDESGVGIISPLFFMGIVENNVDPRMEGRVQVRAFNIHGRIDEVPTEDLPWAICVQGTYDMSNKPPAINSFVLGFFIDGRSAQKPMLMGIIPTQMTQFIDPGSMGYGAIPENMDVSAQGSRPIDIGQPSVPRTARGEDLQDTHVMAISASRIIDAPIPVGYAPKDEPTPVSWEEPSAGYFTQYPHNKVLETASGHVVEYDDTPGGERILIYHRSGSYTQVDARGTTVNKSVSDKYDVNEVNQHVYVGGRSMVSILGDAVLYVGGNAVQQIQGDMNLAVHGDYKLNVGGKIEMVAGDVIVQKAAGIYSEAQSDAITLISKGGTDIASIGPVTVKGDGLAMESASDSSIKSGGDVKISGASFSTNASGQVALDGSQIHLNSGNSTEAPSVPSPEALTTDTVVGKSPPGSKEKNPANLGSIGTMSIINTDDPGEIA